MRVIEDNYNYTKNTDDKQVECCYCGSIFAYNKSDIYKVNTNEYILCPCCGKRMWLGDSDATPETIEYPRDFFQYKTKRNDPELTQCLRDAIEMMKEDGDVGVIEGDALVLAFKDYDNSDYARVFVCKDHAESLVKI